MPQAKVRDGVFTRKDSPGWYASFVDSSGVRRKKRVAAHTRTQALQALAALKTRVQTETVLGVKHQSDISTADLLKRYKRHQKTRLRPTTFVRLEGIIETLKANLPERLKGISKVTVADFISARSLTVSPATVSKEVTTLKHALRLAVDWELIHTNPAERAKLPRVSEGRTRYLSPPELKIVLESAPDWMRVPLALSAFTGMRRGELLSLRWRDVDLAGRRLYLHETKNGALRVVTLNDLAAAVLASLPPAPAESPVLPEVDAMRLSVYTRRLFVSLGIKGASFHSLRHTAASWLVMGGVDLYAVGQILGHKTPRMTQRYAHLSPQYLASAVGTLDTAFSAVMPLNKGGTPTGPTLMQPRANSNQQLQ